MSGGGGESVEIDAVHVPECNPRCDETGHYLCDHPVAAVIISANGDHLCASCGAEWWEDPL